MAFRIDNGNLYRQMTGRSQGFDDATLVRQQELFGTFDAREEGDGHLLLIAFQEDGCSIQHVWFENKTYFIHVTRIVDIDHDRRGQFVECGGKYFGRCQSQFCDGCRRDSRHI